MVRVYKLSGLAGSPAYSDYFRNNPEYSPDAPEKTPDETFQEFVGDKSIRAVV